ncbi:hypothetical protein SDC9_205139 [bioreactor metagenome]|uniref:Tail terminator n=1 Tax=bioreactor metagenome TaxID=1076179 RepID=A0A645J178_9ZZZZ
MMIDEIEVELKLTEWAADVLGLAIDSGIYRGSIPSGARSGVAVMLHEEIRDATLRPSTYNVQILGKFAGDDARDDALRMRARLAAAVPRFGVTVDGVTFTAIQPRGGGEPYRADDDGEIKTYMSVNLLVSVLTNRP